MKKLKINKDEYMNIPRPDYVVPQGLEDMERRLWIKDIREKDQYLEQKIAALDLGFTIEEQWDIAEELFPVPNARPYVSKLPDVSYSQVKKILEQIYKDALLFGKITLKDNPALRAILIEAFERALNDKISVSVGGDEYEIEILEKYYFDVQVEDEVHISSPAERNAFLLMYDTWTSEMNDRYRYNRYDCWWSLKVGPMLYDNYVSQKSCSKLKETESNISENTN